MDLIDAAALNVPSGLALLDFPLRGGGMRSERHAATCMLLPSMLARASAGVR